MKISAHEALVTTATVEIRTLTISGKQVTLAVFRQLLDERWEDEEGGLQGTAWGTVNYHPDPRCKTGPEHLHVIWERDGELRRAFHERPPAQPDLWAESDGSWLDVALVAGLRPTLRSDGLVRVRFEAGATDVYPSREATDFLNGLRWRPEKEPSDALIEKARLLCSDGWSLERWRSAVEEELIECHHHHQRRLENWKLVSDLPQLFIAV